MTSSHKLGSRKVSSRLKGDVPYLFLKRCSHRVAKILLTYKITLLCEKRVMARGVGGCQCDPRANKLGLIYDKENIGPIHQRCRSKIIRRLSKKTESQTKNTHMERDALGQEKESWQTNLAFKHVLSRTVIPYFRASPAMPALNRRSGTPSLSTHRNNSSWPGRKSTFAVDTAFAIMSLLKPASVIACRKKSTKEQSLTVKKRKTAGVNDTAVGTFPLLATTSR